MTPLKPILVPGARPDPVDATPTETARTRPLQVASPMVRPRPPSWLRAALTQFQIAMTAEAYYRTRDPSRLPLGTSNSGRLSDAAAAAAIGAQLYGATSTSRSAPGRLRR